MKAGNVLGIGAAMHPNRKQSIEEGAPRFEGVPCRICGGTLRYTINCDCVKCSRDRAKVCQRKARQRMREARLQREVADQ